MGVGCDDRAEADLIGIDDVLRERFQLEARCEQQAIVQLEDSFVLDGEPTCPVLARAAA